MHEKPSSAAAVYHLIIDYAKRYIIIFPSPFFLLHPFSIYERGIGDHADYPLAEKDNITYPELCCAWKLGIWLVMDW